MSTRKQIENYCKKNKLIELSSDNLGGDKYYLNTKKNIVIKFSLFSKNPISFEIATKSEINEIIKSYERQLKSSKRNSSEINEIIKSYKRQLKSSKRSSRRNI